LFDAPFWALVALILFFAIVIYMKVPGTLAGSLDKRAEAIGKELDEARRLRVEAEALLAEYQRKAKDAAAEAGQIIDQARREADALGVEAKRRIEDYVASRTKMAEQKIAQAETQAIQEVRSISADVAIAAAGKVLATKVKGAAADTLIAKTIADVRGKLN
jgi:F-type H+-transporting ATPase subunit b